MTNLLESFSSEYAGGPKFVLQKLTQMEINTHFRGLLGVKAEEIKLEKELGPNVAVYRAMTLYTIGDDETKLVPMVYARKAKLPFNQGIVYFKPAEEEGLYPLTSTAVNKIFGPRFREAREFLKIHRHAVHSSRPKPDRKASEMERSNAFEIATNSIDRLRKKIYETLFEDSADGDVLRTNRVRYDNIKSPEDIGAVFMNLQVMRQTNAILISTPSDQTRRIQEGVMTEDAARRRFGTRPSNISGWLPDSGYDATGLDALTAAARTRREDWSRPQLPPGTGTAEQTTGLLPTGGEGTQHAEQEPEEVNPAELEGLQTLPGAEANPHASGSYLRRTRPSRW